jgi:hypothetical protein
MGLGFGVVALPAGHSGAKCDGWGRLRARGLAVAGGVGAWGLGGGSRGPVWSTLSHDHGVAYTWGTPGPPGAARGLRGDWGTPWAR